MGTIFRVLLAGRDAHDLERAAKILSGREDVLVTIAHTHAATLTALPHVDVAICQVKAPCGSAEDVDAFALLQTSQTPSQTPIAVILDGQSAADTMATAVQLGALDILQAPISEQSDRLLFHTEKWKHTLPRKSKDAKELSSGQASDCFSLDIPVPRTEVLSQLDTDSLDELFGSATSSGTMFDGDWAQSEALAAEIMPHLFGGDDSFCGQQAFNTGFDALASCETELFLNQLVDDTSQTQPSGSSDGSVSYLPLGRQTSLATCSAPAMGKRKSEEFEVTMHTSSAELTDDARYKKQKVEWTAELHNVFVAVVERIGVDIAVPSQILTAMGKHAKGLTRQNIASHLQKYRNRSRTGLTTTSYGSAPPAGTMDAAVCSFLPTAQPAALSAVPWWATVNTGLSPAYPLQTAGCVGWPASPPLVAAPPPAAMQPSPQLLASIQAAIRAPQGRLPIGLKLDANAVMTGWKAAARTYSGCNTPV